MNFYNQVRRIERIDYLIRSHSTGTPAELARKLRISQSQLYQTIRIMRDVMDAPLYYSKIQQSYCYHEHVKFICTFAEILEK